MAAPAERAAIIISDASFDGFRVAAMLTASYR